MNSDPVRTHRPFLIAAVSALAIVAGFTSCASFSGETLSRTRFLMGTECRIEGPVEEITPAQIDDAFAEIGRVERLLSTWLESSELSRLNRSAESSAVTVEPELAGILAESLRWAGDTDGAFNPLVGPLVRLWKTREEGALPSEQAIAAALASMRLDLVTIDSENASIIRRGGAEFEEGGFGKGYALDRAIEVLRDAGAGRALIDFGGQLALFGFDDGLHVAIAHPEERQRPVMTVLVREGSISTSSGSERPFVVGGVRFSHLIDPRTGRALPERGSVTVIHSEALAADILSTALYVMGPEEGLEWADSRGIAAIFLVPAGHRYEARLSRAVKYDLKVNEKWVAIP